MSAFRHACVVIGVTLFESLRVIVGALRGVGRERLNHYVRSWAERLVNGCGVRVRVEGEAPDPARPLLIMTNHRSHFDTPCLMTALPRMPYFVAKQELRRIPIFGRGMEAFGMIFVDRGKSEKARAALALAARRVRAGDWVVMFPEGSRSEDGVSLRPFKKGGFHLAKEAGVAILPVAILGTERVLPKHSLCIRSSEVTVRLGRLIPVEPESGVDELLATTRADMQRLIDLP